MISGNDKQDTSSELQKLLRIIPPKTPSESITSRRKNCFGPALVVDMQSFPQVHDLCQRTLKSIISIIDPEHNQNLFPRKSPNYIKQKFFHASVFSMTPFVYEGDHETFYFSKAGLDGGYFLKEMQEKAQKYLKEYEPKLIPKAFEYNEALGTIFARYTFEPNDFDPNDTHAAPLLELSRILDPTEKFPIWDPNPYRHRSVAVVLCALDIEDTNMKQRIKLILKENSEKLQTIGPLTITNLVTIDKYNKRTISDEHIHIFNPPYNIKHLLQELSLFEKCSHNYLMEHRNKKPIIIWDGGGVVVEFNPSVMAETFEGGRFKEQIKALFASQDWKDYDNGNFNEDVLKAKRHDIPSEKFMEIFNFFLKSLKPKKETIELIKQLDKLGYQQFYLSNGSRSYVNYINSSEYFKNEGFNLSELFSEHQILLSADINISKPRAGIFEKAKEKFKLDKRSVIFIDDSFLNIKAATEYAGWDGVQFRDIQKLKSVLALKGVFLSSNESKNENNKVFAPS